MAWTVADMLGHFIPVCRHLTSCTFGESHNVYGNIKD